ncbi:hypothetical protein FV222_00250 [Methylobacterium sp. WL103]|uniref:hypothetical protein n=1 Tax=Methylobacterium sp. WL103 TaxID=2603891 RepID=UPI0011C983DB|nr:hypothetical protein [Methylobacterium sp. WL103]TXN08936.1 hypothetical protein FV222_00250 [Methylobacterium sp. WL103]
MDIFTVSNLVAGISIGGSAAMMAIAGRRYKNAAEIERDASNRFYERAACLTDERYDRDVAFLTERLEEQAEVNACYYQQLIANIDAMQVGTDRIRALNTDVAIYDEQFEELDLVLRAFYPDLPESYEPGEAVHILVASALGQSFVETFRDSPEDGKRFIADLVEKLTSEVELRDGEIADREMKHEHLMAVLRHRNLEIDNQAATIMQQGEVISELREEKRLAEVELTATKVAANDDSSDADRYADDLRKADELIHFFQLHDIELPESLIAPLAEANFRISVRKNANRGEGVAIARLAA